MAENKKINLVINKAIKKSVNLVINKADLGTWTPQGMSGTGASPKGYKPGSENITSKKDVVGEKAAQKMGMPSATGKESPGTKIQVSKEVKGARTKVMPESVMTSAKPTPPAIPESTKKAINDLKEATKALEKSSDRSDYAMNALVRHHYHKEAGNEQKASNLRRRFDHMMDRGAKPEQKHADFYLNYHGKQSTDPRNSTSGRAEHSKRLEATHTALNELKNVSKGTRLPTPQDLPGKPQDFGKPMVQREGESSNDFMSRIVSHLVTDKNYTQKRAVAAAYEMSDNPKVGKMRKALTGASVPRVSRVRIKASEIDIYRSATTPISRVNCVHDVDSGPLSPNHFDDRTMSKSKFCGGCGRSYNSDECPTCETKKSYYCGDCGRQMIKSMGGGKLCPKCNK